jgi:EmrB/QacA subfamily drug resistance transporter
LADQPTADTITSPSAAVRRRLLVLVAVMMGMFMSAVESTIVASAMPTIVAELGGFQLFSWVFAIYLLAQAITIPIYGRLADLYGRKRVFCAGAALFLLGSALCGFAWNMVALIGFRALQGLGAGAIIPVASTIVADIYAPADRARMQGYLGGVWGVAAIIGPALGAFIVQHLSWSIIFWINLPVGVISIAMLAFFLREHLVPHDHTIDYGGSALLMVGSGALMLGLTQAHQLSPPLFWGLIAAAAVALGSLLRHERVAAEPMLRLDLWRHRIIAVANVGATTIGAVMMGITAFLPAYVQGAMGRSPLVAGFALTVMSLGWTAASAIAGQVMVRTSYRAAAVLGGLGLLMGNLVLILMQPGSGPVWAGSGAFLVGMGMGFCNTTFLVSIQCCVDWGERGTATSSMLFMRMVGQSLGVAMFGAVFNYVLFGAGSEAGDVVNRLMEPTLRLGLDAGEIARLTDEIARALHDVYLIGLAISALTLLLATTLPAGQGPEAVAAPVEDQGYGCKDETRIGLSEAEWLLLRAALAGRHISARHRAHRRPGRASRAPSSDLELAPGHQANQRPPLSRHRARL